ncbi:WxL domain-containing protein [Enterococcus alishanensis]
MKRKVLAGLLASVSVLGLCLSGTTALAATTDKTSDATITFTEEVKAGELQFRHIPATSAFNFGTKVAPTGVSTVEEFTQADSGYLVIQDDRAPATGNQWVLSAKLGQITKVNSSADNLAGAKLLFTGTSRDYLNPDGGGLTAPGPNNGTIGAKNNSSAIATGSVELVQDAAAEEVLRDGTAGVSSKQGYSALEMSAIKLSVLGDTADAGQYKGTITWTLDDLV